LRDHERRLERLEKYEPAVVQQRLNDLDRELSQLEARIMKRLDESDTRAARRLDESDDRSKWQTRALIGAMLTMLGSLTVFLLLIPHG